MARMTPDERALPRPGKVTRTEAWRIAQQHEGFVVTLTRRFALRCTNNGATTFAGFETPDLFDELIGAAWEGCLIAAERHDPSRGRFTTYATRSIGSALSQTAEDLLMAFGHNVNVTDEVPDIYAVEDDYPSETEPPMISAREYVERLIINLDITDEQRRWAYETMRPTGVVIPYFSPAWRDLKDKIVKRAMWLQAEGFGYPDGWERAIQRRIIEYAREYVDEQAS